MSEAEKKSKQIAKLQKKISEELNVIENDIKGIEKLKRDSIEKIEIKKIEIKNFSSTQSVCAEHYATLQEIALTSKEIEDRKSSITALDTTIANLDLQIAKIQSDHDKAVAELERKRRKLNDYLKYYEDLNDKLETLIKLLSEEEKKHCIELNNLKIERAKALARTDLSEDALNKLLKELDNKMTNLNIEHGILIDSISQKLSDITVDKTVEEFLTDEKKLKKRPDATKKEPITTKTGDEEIVSEVGKKPKHGDEKDYKTEDEAGEGEKHHEEDGDKHLREREDGEDLREREDGGDKDIDEREDDDDDKYFREREDDGDKHLREREDGEDKYLREREDDGDKHGDERDEDGKKYGDDAVKKGRKEPLKAGHKVVPKGKIDKDKAKPKDVEGMGARGPMDDITSDEEFDEDLIDFLKDEEAKGRVSLTKDRRIELLRQGLQITPSNRIITKDDRVLTMQEAQRLGLLGAYLLDEAEEEEDEEGVDDLYSLLGKSISRKGKKKKGKGKKGKEMEPVQYYESPASSESSLAKESSESVLCGRDNEYLKVVFGKSLTVALAEITAVQPADPIHYLAHWMLQYRYNQEIDQITRIQIQELMIEQERLAAEKWHRELQEEARLAVLEALFRAENIIIQQDYQSQLLQEYEGEYEAMSHVNANIPAF